VTDDLPPCGPARDARAVMPHTERDYALLRQGMRLAASGNGGLNSRRGRSGTPSSNDAVHGGSGSLPASGRHSPLGWSDLARQVRMLNAMLGAPSVPPAARAGNPWAPLVRYWKAMSLIQAEIASRLRRMERREA